MRQSFRDLSKADWEKKKLHYEALIQTDSYRRLVDEAFTKWAKEGNLDFNQCKMTTARERFFAEPNLQASLLANNVNIPYLFDPDKELPEVAVSMAAVRTIRRQASDFLVEESPPNPHIKLRPIGSKTPPSPKKEFVPLKPHKKDGRHLLIAIDLHAPKERILAEIEEKVKIHKLTIQNETPKRGIAHLSENNLSPFKIYNMAKSRKKLCQITRELFPHLKDKKNVIDEAMSYYMVIWRLNEKAKKLIQEAEESIPKFLKTRLRRSGNLKEDPGPA